MTDETDAATAPMAFVCAMPMELRPLARLLRLRPATVDGLPGYEGTLDGRPVVAVATGMGTELARHGVTRLLDGVRPSCVIVVGITGAVDDDTPIGTIVRPERVIDHATGREHVHRPLDGVPARGAMWTTDVITAAGDLPALRARGVVSLDMETAAVADVCEQRGVPWTVVRVISDRASDGSVDDEVFRLSNQDGTPNPRAIARYLVRHPGRIPRLVQLAKGSAVATRRAAEAAVAAARAIP